jgi:multicomponent Na+:H+ antiporter subunit F
MIEISYYFIIAALILAFLRFLAGKSSLDRLVAVDVLTTIGVSALVLYTLSSRVIYIDVPMVYALLGFVGVVAIARYYEGGM